MEIAKIDGLIQVVRGQRVMLDANLAALYGVKTKELNKAVRRNRVRFPADFMFQMTAVEAESLRFQIGTSKKGRGGRRYLPLVFTEHGVAMLSSVLSSERAITGQHRDRAGLRKVEAGPGCEQGIGPAHGEGGEAA